MSKILGSISVFPTVKLWLNQFNHIITMNCVNTIEIGGSNQLIHRS